MVQLERSLGGVVTSVRRTGFAVWSTMVAATAVVLAAGAALAVEELPRELPPAIPPGQESLLQEMLGKGADLPGNCKLADGHVEYTVIEATYECGNGAVVIELAHSSWAVASDVQTRYFALGVTKGSAPASLVDTLAALILDREGDFEWAQDADDGALEGSTAE